MKKQYYIWGIIILAFVVRAWHLTTPDLVTDDALYSFRALGWFDYLGGGQSTPIDWFGAIPGWANLSFHDAPPVVFFIQKIFFALFGATTLAARLPFFIFGVASVYVVYLIATAVRGREAGWLASFLLAVSAAHIWISVIGYLEGVEIFFILLTLWLFIRFQQTNGKQWLYLFAAALGVTLMTKYTALFLLPLFLIYLLLHKITFFKTKEFWFACIVLIVAVSPVIIYNYNVYINRGHLDAALSSMIGMKHEDFSAVGNRSESISIVNNFSSAVVGVLAVNSLAVIGLFVVAVGYWLYRLLFKRGGSSSFDTLIVLGFVFCFIILMVGRLDSEHFVVLLSPFIVLLIGIVLYDIFVALKSVHIRIFWPISAIILTLCLGVEVLYTINSHFFPTPFASPLLGRSFAPALNSNLGFNQLDRYLLENVFPPTLSLQRPTSMEAMVGRAQELITRYSTLYLFDDSLNWFAHTWYVQKYFMYYGLPITSIQALVESSPNTDPITTLRAQGIKTFYFVYPVDESVIDPVKIDNQDREISAALAQFLEQGGATPTEIKNHQGVTVFKVYAF